MDSQIFQFVGVSHQFGDVKVLDSVSFGVGRGRMLGVLGCNGSGKSTLFRVACGVLKPDSGCVLCEGESVLGSGFGRRFLGVTFQSPSLDKRLTVRENLKLFGYLCGVGQAELRFRIQRLVGEFGLDDYLEAPVSVLSGGYVRRVELAKCLIAAPRVLLLDEPTVGLDYSSRVEFWRLLATLKDRDGVTLLVSSHLLEEVAVCDEVLVLDSGRVLAHDRPSNLSKTLFGDHVSIVASDCLSLSRKLLDRFGYSFSVNGGRLEGQFADGVKVLAVILSEFSGEIFSVSTGKATLEDCLKHFVTTRAS